MSTYAYEPLAAGQPRILELFPGKTTEPLKGSLRTFSLKPEDTPEPDYEALSYVWGRPPGHDQIFLLTTVKASRDRPEPRTCSVSASTRGPGWTSLVRPKLYRPEQRC